MRFRNDRVEVGKVAEVLGGFQPDVIFLDPARRAEDGRKVFLIEECQPDVVGLLPELFAASRL
ncbi:MAG: SAM-dependent methyltransferase, partial [Bacteroidales bacterium]|nr:SAM-dependent methyltransferase [Bacteroidales bacterium]